MQLKWSEPPLGAHQHGPLFLMGWYVYMTLKLPGQLRCLLAGCAENGLRVVSGGIQTIGCHAVVPADAEKLRHGLQVAASHLQMGALIDTAPGGEEGHTLGPADSIAACGAAAEGDP